jgi:hypothetical protein
LMGIVSPVNGGRSLNGSPFVQPIVRMEFEFITLS